MMNFKSRVRRSIVIMRPTGTMTHGTLIAMAGAIAEFDPSDAKLFLFDWMGIDSWDFSTPKESCVAALHIAASQMVRVAIVHGPRLNRPVAWVAAILREEGVMVRSWRAEQAAAAAAWLKGKGS